MAHQRQQSSTASGCLVLFLGLMAFSFLVQAIVHFPLESALVVMLAVWWWIRRRRKVLARKALEQAAKQAEIEYQQALTFLTAEDRKWIKTQEALIKGQLPREP
jgi:predicted RNA-binding protein Jag